jgi:hypothetical protein
VETTPYYGDESSMKHFDIDFESIGDKLNDICYFDDSVEFDNPKGSK